MSALTPAEVLALMPQQRPMRFIDEILELDDEHLLACYTWKEEDCAGHFPGNPVVPGVKIIEMAAQTGNAAWGIYHLGGRVSREELKTLIGFFTETEVEYGVFKKMVRPGEKVSAMARFGEDGHFRGNNMASYVKIQFMGGPKDGEEIFSGKTAGLWAPRNSESLK